MPKNAPSRSEKLAAARQSLTKKYGEGAIAPVSYDMGAIDVIPSGSFLLDAALGIGGFPRGRLIELYGPPSCGKSTLSLAACSNCQKLDLPVLYLDFEQAFSPLYAKRLGVDFDSNLWVLSQPDSLEQGMSIAETFIEESIVGLVVVDSLAAMVTDKELAGEIGDTQVAIQARALAQVLKRLTAKIHRSNVAVLFINHVRDTIGGMPGRAPRKTTPGGSALKFYASVRIELTPIESIKGKITDLITGKLIDGSVSLKVKALVVKNKLAPPYREGRFYLRVGRGLCEEESVIEAAVARDVIHQNGSRYVLPFNTENDKQVNLAGLTSVLDWLAENPLSYQNLKSQITALVANQEVAPIIVESDDPDPEALDLFVSDNSETGSVSFKSEGLEASG